MDTEMTQLLKGSSASSHQDGSNDQEHNKDGSRSKQEGSNNEEDNEDINRSKQEGSNNEEDNEDINRSKQEGSNNEEDNEDINRSAEECTKCKDKLAEKDKEIKRLKKESGEKDTEIRSLRKELQTEKSKLDAKHRKLVTCQSVFETYKDERSDEIERLQSMEENLAEHKKIINSTLTEQEKLKQELKEKTDEVTSTLIEQEKLKQELKEKTDEVTSLYYAKRDVEHTIDVYVSDNKRLTLEAANLRNTSTKEIKRIEELIKDMKAAKQEIAQLQRTETTYKKKLKEAEQKLTSAQNDTKTTKDELKRCQDERSKLRAAYQQQKGDLEWCQDERLKLWAAYQQQNGDLKRLQSDLVIAQQERDQYQVRLSALMSTKLTTNNPEITDLSDINRPTKLAEQWGDLYDNEYTELFEALQCDDEKKISLILKLLKRSSEICQEIREPGVNWLTYFSENNAMHNPISKMEEEGDTEPRSNEEPVDHEDPESVSSKGDKKEETKDSRSNGKPGDNGCQDSASSLGDKNKGGESQVDPEPESEIENKEGTKESRSNGELGDDAGQDSASSLGDKNEGVESQVNPDPKYGIDDTKGGESQVDPDTESEKDTKKGGESQADPDPGIENKEGDKKPRHNEEPVDHEDPESASSKGDKNTDEERNDQADSQQLSSSLKQSAVKIDDNQKQTMDKCSQTATTEVVKLDVPDELKRELMVALSPYLKKKALEIVDILNKELPERVAKEFDMAWKTGNALDVYLKSCIRLCWLMGIQSPPVYIRFDEHDQASRHVKLDKNFYREYTKAGQHIDYVVWPPLQLYKEGPLLRRGVAQGTDSKD